MNTSIKTDLPAFLQRGVSSVGQHKVIARFFMRRRFQKEDLIRLGYSEASAESATRRLFTKRILAESLLRIDQLRTTHGITSKRKALELAAQIIANPSMRGIA